LNERINMNSASYNENWDRLKPTFKQVKIAVEDSLLSDAPLEDAIYHASYRFSQIVDWYCNNEHPKGGHCVPSEDKEEMIRKALANYFRCLNKARVTTKICDGCDLRARCYTSSGSDSSKHPTQRRTEIMKEIRSGIKICGFR